jgi:YEATS domain-containing protein 4
MDPFQGKTVALATTSAALPNSECRLEKTTACLPIVYGSVAFCLGKKADENSTHQWTLYLRGNTNEDLSHCIQKVIFQLHPSFAQPVRELTAPPYEVTERGWGEFEAQIRIIWKDATEKATVVSSLIYSTCLWYFCAGLILLFEKP